MACFGENWDDNTFPLAYLITIRTYGTWLHGDERESIDTHGNYNLRGALRRAPSARLKAVMAENMKQPPFVLRPEHRLYVEAAIREVCDHRRFFLHATSVRSNHGHAVVSAQMMPELIANAFKSYATRALRREGIIDADCRPWSRGRSRRYLWKDQHVAAAIEYVLYCQGDVEFEDWYSKKFDD